MSGATPERVVVDVADLEAGDLREVEAGGLKLLLCNAGGEIFAVENRCTHAAMPLIHGRLRGSILECPLHGARFDVRDGSVVSPHARRPLPTYPVRIEAGRAEIRIGGSIS